MRRLLLILLLIGLVWGLVLPRLSKTKTVRQREAWLEQKGIDPAAMFYTDLPLLDLQR